MKRTWRNIIIVSFVLIAIELVGSVIFLRPYHQVRQVFDGIDAGQWDKANESYEKLNASQKKEVQSYLDSFGAWICRQYIDGDKTYEQAAGGFDAIRSIDESETIFDKYVPRLDEAALKSVINEYWNAVQLYDTEVAQDANIRSMNIQKRIKTPVKEQYMIELLNEKYQEFLDEKVSYDGLISFGILIQSSSYYDAYNYAGLIMYNALCVEKYRQHYDTLTAMKDNNRYLEVMRACREVDIDKKDRVYSKKYDELYNRASEEGIEFYKEELEALVRDEKKEEASELMDEIASVYGDDFELTAIKKSMLSEWQNAYIDMLKDVETRLKSDLANSETGNYILENRYDRLKPDSLVLHDIDDNGVAELFLFNSSQIGSNYIGCFIYTCSGSTVSYVGYSNVISFCTDNSIISFPISFGRSEGTEYVLEQFDGSSLYEVSSCQDMGDVYYVNHEESDELGFMSQRTIILGHESEKNIANSESESLDNAEKLIMAY